MKNLSLLMKLLAIVALFSVGGASYVTVVNMTTKEKLDDSDYKSGIAMRELVADALPPPLFVLEPYAVGRELTRAKDPARREQLLTRWRQLEMERAQRETYWADRLAAVGISSMRGPLVEVAGRTGARVIDVGNKELIPAVESGDEERVSRALAQFEKTYYEHRAAIDQFIALALKEQEKQESAAADAIAARKLWLTLLGSAIMLLGTLGAVTIARSVAARTQTLKRVLQQVAAGDLTQRAPVDASDEIGQMAHRLNESLEAIEAAFQQVRRVAVALAEAAPQLASSSDQISNGAQQQAASLEETAASLEEITAAVKQSAGNAQQASQLALSSRDVAEKGGEVVTDAVRAMNEIMKSSRRIGDIITTIDEVALQTNLLALNAAVEAARAGELGRGFAVVAAEVGNLAQRSAAAAKEVKTLIQDSLQRVEAGHSLVDQSGKSLHEIIHSVKKVTDVVGEIAAAAREQSVGVDQVNQAVSQMDQVTQTNAAQTQELTRTAEHLADSARRLRELVERFQLGDVGDDAFAGSRKRGAPPKLERVAKRRSPDNDNDASPPRYGQASGADFEVV
jgi:methyl-accepting chemotaxis protein